MWNVQCAMWNVQCAMCNVGCGMCNVQCAMLHSDRENKGRCMSKDIILSDKYPLLLFSATSQREGLRRLFGRQK